VLSSTRDDRVELMSGPTSCRGPRLMQARAVRSRGEFLSSENLMHNRTPGNDPCLYIVSKQEGDRVNYHGIKPPPVAQPER